MFFFLGAKGAGNFAFKFSNVGLCLPRLPSTQKSRSLPTNLVVEVGLHGKISDLLFKIGTLVPRGPLSGL